MRFVHTAITTLAGILSASNPAKAGTVWQINAPFAPWLWPAMAILGIVLQLGSLRRQSRLLAWIGCLLVMAGAWPEKDITLATGDILACLGLSYIYWKNSGGM